MNLQGIFAFILMLGSLIFIHESGHFLLAKLFRVRVLVFSLGFGPRLVGWRKGATDYRVSLIPLGGYVKMQGENPDEALAGSGDEFLSRSKPVRFCILAMGAVMNLLLAVAIYWGLYTYGIQDLAYRQQPAVVGIVQQDSPAEEAGLLPGDEILVLGRKEVETWDEYVTEVRLNPNTDTQIQILRNGLRQTLPLHIGIPPHDNPLERYRMGYVGVVEHIPLFFQEIVPDTPASQAGLETGDRLLELDGESVHGPWHQVFDTIAARIKETLGSSFELTVERDGRPVVLTLHPAEKDGEGWIGVSMGPELELKRYGPVEALRASVKKCGQDVVLLFVSLRQLVTLKLSLRAMSGPIDIYQFSAQAYQAGWLVFFQLMAFISLNLGIFNLLPIPVLDGGHIFVLLIEGILRRDLSMQAKERLMLVGFVFLVTLMGLVISFDIIKRIG